MSDHEAITATETFGQTAGQGTDAPASSKSIILRSYPSWTKWLCACLCVVSGVFCSIVFKWQNKVDVTPCDGCEKIPFEGALYQTQTMFISESLGIFIYYGDKFLSRRKNKAPMFDFAQSAKAYEEKEGPFWYWPICSLLDFIATLLIMLSLKMTYASTVQMLRNFMVVLCAFLQPVFMKKAIRIHEAIGVALITVAMVLTAIPAITDPDTSLDVSTKEIVAGVVLAVVGTSVQSIQLLIEEFFIKKGRSSPLRCVGWEGIGGLVYSFVAWPICQKAGLENVSHSWYASLHSGYLTGLTIAYLPTGTIFNVAGLATTLLGSGLLRGVCFALRSPLVWIISLIIKWQSYDHWSLASAIVFCIGFAVYVNVTGFPHGSAVDRTMWKAIHCGGCITDRSKDEPYEKEVAVAEAVASLEGEPAQAV